MTDETITIRKIDYEELLSDQRLLRALEAAGVDNWQGFDEAVKMLHNATEKD